MQQHDTALRLRRLLEDEGCHISRAIGTRIMQHMGGGVGMVATAPIRGPSTELVRIPFRTMLTVGKARMHLALVEAEFERQYALASNPVVDAAVAAAATCNSISTRRERKDSSSSQDAHEGDGGGAGGVSPCNRPFTLRFYAMAEPNNAEDSFLKMCGYRMSRHPSQSAPALSDGHVHHLRQICDRLEAALTPAETLLAYIGLQAALHGRLEYDGITKLPLEVAGAAAGGGGKGVGKGGLPQGYRQQHGPNATTTRGGTASSASPSAALAQILSEGRHRIHFFHDNAWMRDWMESLPPQYDNALELQRPRAAAAASVPTRTTSTTTTSSSSSSSIGPMSPHSLPDVVRAHLFFFPRLRKKVEKEQGRAYQMYVKCLRTLHCLRCLPCGVDMRTTTTTTTAVHKPTESGGISGGQTYYSRQAPSAVSGPISFQQFLWCLNCVASRGFGFPLETWVMMPYVDYFNYALQPNILMNPVKDLLGRSSRAKQQLREQRFHGPSSGSRGGDGLFFCSPSAPRGSDYVFSFTTLEPAARGAQLFLCYGAYSDAELLLWYGFTLRPALLPTSLLLALEAKDDARLHHQSASTAAAAAMPEQEQTRTLEETTTTTTTTTTADRVLDCDVYSTTRLAEGVARHHSMRPDGCRPEEEDFERLMHQDPKEEEEEEEEEEVDKEGGGGGGGPPRRSADVKECIPFNTSTSSSAGRGSHASSTNPPLLPSFALRDTEMRAMVRGLERLHATHNNDGRENEEEARHRHHPPKGERAVAASPRDRVFLAWLEQQLVQEGEGGAGTALPQRPPTGAGPYWLVARLPAAQLRRRRRQWRTAVQAALCHVFSPLENVEGEWDEEEEEEEGATTTTTASSSSWLHRLISRFVLHTPALTPERALAMIVPRSTARRDSSNMAAPMFYFLTEADARAAVALDAGVRHFFAALLGPLLGLSFRSAGPATHAVPVAEKMDKEDYCGLGCFHPTPALQQLLRRLGAAGAEAVRAGLSGFGGAVAPPSTPFFTPGLVEAYATIKRTAHRSSSIRERSRNGGHQSGTAEALRVALVAEMVRGLAWAEWATAAHQCHGAGAQELVAEEKEDDPSPLLSLASSACMSPCAATRAVQVSVDAGALLYFFALRATAPGLLRYAAGGCYVVDGIDTDGAASEEGEEEEEEEEEEAEASDDDDEVLSSISIRKKIDTCVVYHNFKKTTKKKQNNKLQTTNKRENLNLNNSAGFVGRIAVVVIGTSTLHLRTSIYLFIYFLLSITKNNQLLEIKTKQTIKQKENERKEKVNSPPSILLILLLLLLLLLLFLFQIPSFSEVYELRNPIFPSAAG
eukprot:gene6979-4943_t